MPLWQEPTKYMAKMIGLNKLYSKNFRNQSYSIDMHYSLFSTDKEALDIGECLKAYGWVSMHNQDPKKQLVESY